MSESYVDKDALGKQRTLGKLAPWDSYLSMSLISGS